MSEKSKVVETASPDTSNQSTSGESRRRRKGKRSGRRRQIPEGEQPFWMQQKPEEVAETETAVVKDDDFGNRRDYVPTHGHGIGGIYREPMDGGGGGHWSQPQGRSHSRRQHIYQEMPEGVLTMRTPGWKERGGESEEERFVQKDDGVLTIRQQADLARSLRYNKDQQPAQLSRYEQGRDPAQAWQRFMDDLKSGRENTRRKRSEDRRKRGQRKRQQNKEQQ